MSLAFAGRAAGKHPLSVFVSRRTKVTGIFLPPSHMRLQHGRPPKRKPVSLLLGFWFLHPPHPVPPASTQTGRSGPTFQVTRFPRREGQGPLGRRPRDLTCHPGKAPLFPKTRGRESPECCFESKFEARRVPERVLASTPPTASTLIITSEKARPAVGFFWREPGCPTKAARPAEEKAERVSQELRHKSGRGGCTPGGPSRPGRSPSCRPPPGTGSLRHFPGSAVPSVPLTALFFDLENRRR